MEGGKRHTNCTVLGNSNLVPKNDCVAECHGEDNLRSQVQPESLEKSGGRRSANAARASRASADCRRSPNKALSRLICEAMRSVSRINDLVWLREPAGRFANASAALRALA